MKLLSFVLCGLLAVAEAGFFGAGSHAQRHVEKREAVRSMKRRGLEARVAHCAGNCLGQAIGGSGCPSGDSRCICESHGFVGHVDQCATTQCTEQEAREAVEYAEAFCHKVQPTRTWSHSDPWQPTHTSWHYTSYSYTGTHEHPTWTWPQPTTEPWHHPTTNPWHHPTSNPWWHHTTTTPTTTHHHTTSTPTTTTTKKHTTTTTKRHTTTHSHHTRTTWHHHTTQTVW